MSTPGGTDTTSLRRSKRLKTRNVIKAKMGTRFEIVDEEDCQLILDAIPNNFILSVEIEDDTKRVRELKVTEDRADRTDDYDLPENLGSLSKLQLLSFTDLGLSCIPSSIGMLQNLTKLRLSGNLLSSLPDEIGNLKNLTSLSLWRNQLNHLPTSIGRLKCLRSLCLCCNSLSVLPTSIGNLNCLEEFDVSHNRLSSLPTSLGNLSYLEEFRVSRNPLYSLPTSIGRLKNLRLLILNNTSIHSLPTSFADLESLETLDISEISGLKQLPKEIFELSAIRRLCVSGDDSLLRDVRNLKSLKHLCIDGLESSYDFSSIQYLQQLEVLDLWGLSRLFDVRKLGVVRKLPNLKTLSFVYEDNVFITEEAIRFILDLIRNTSLCEVDLELEEGNPEITYALACNRFKFRTPFAAQSNGKELLFLNKLWPRMLANARCALDTLVEDPDFFDSYPRIEPYDAVYKVLSEGKGFFVQMLLSRSSSKSK